VTQQRRNLFRIVLPTLIASTRQANPAARAIHGCASVCKHRRQFGVQHPPTRTDRPRIRAGFKQQTDHFDVFARGGIAHRAGGIEHRLVSR